MPKLVPLQGDCVLAFRHDSFLIGELLMYERYKKCLCITAPASFIFLNYGCVKMVCFPLYLNCIFNGELRINSRQDNKLMTVVSTSPFSIKMREPEFQLCSEAPVD